MWVLLGISIYALYLGTITADKNRWGEVKRADKGRYNVKHYQIGSVLLALMVIGAIAMAVTYINNQKAVFGPHLLVGLGMTAMIAVFSFTLSFMQKGKIGHPYCFKFGSLALFSWQAVSGVKLSKYP